MNMITFSGWIPVKVSVKDLLIVTAGFAKEVDDVNQYAPVIYIATEIAGSLFAFIVNIIVINSPIVAKISDTKK